MIVSLSGKPGSGKSTVAKKLARALGYKRYYIGAMFRQEARERGITLVELLKQAEQNDQDDKKFDKIVKELGHTQDNFVIESRTAFHFIPNSIKIFLDITAEGGAKRIWLALKEKTQPNRNEDKNIKTYQDVLKSVRDRVRSSTIRYQKFYNLDIFDKKNYDFFLDTTDLDPDEEYNQVHKFVKERMGK